MAYGFVSYSYNRDARAIHRPIFVLTDDLSHVLVVPPAHAHAKAKHVDVAAVANAVSPAKRLDSRFVERRQRSRKPLIYRHSHRAHFLQRSRDIVLSSVALIVAAPVLLVAAIAIGIEDGGPVLFTQQRVGRFEKLFTIYKLRTMRVTLCGDSTSPTKSSDHRITNVGRFLRKTSIDELPQLVNIIRGDMTLVGPRPEMPFIVRRYARWQHLRHLQTPGLTGLWQITYRSTVPLERFEATAIDLEYIDRSSAVFDFKLILRTIFVLLGSKGAY